MKIIIIDDDILKIRNIVNHLLTLGAREEDIDYAMSINSAKQLIKRSQYHLMLIDLIIPRREDQEPTQGAGIEFVNEVCSRTRYFEPFVISAITAFDEAGKEFSKNISSYMASLINYSDESEQWKGEIDKIYAECLRRIEKGVNTAMYDISFICTLEDSEERQLLRLLDCKSESKLSSSGIIYRSGEITISERNVTFTVSRISQMGSIASASHTSRIINDFKPRYIFMTGICAGVGADVQLGDIIIAQSTWDWQSGKYTLGDGGVTFSISPHHVNCSDAMEKLIRSHISSTGSVGVGIRQPWPGDGPRSDPRVFLGPVASGSSVVAAQDKIAEIRDSQNRKMIGLEMEAYGMYLACRDDAHRPLDFLMIKSVSDKADENKDDSMRQYAAYASAQFILKIISENIDSLF